MENGVQFHALLWSGGVELTGGVEPTHWWSGLEKPLLFTQLLKYTQQLSYGQCVISKATTTKWGLHIYSEHGMLNKCCGQGKASEWGIDKVVLEL